MVMVVWLWVSKWWWGGEVAVVMAVEAVAWRWHGGGMGGWS